MVFYLLMYYAVLFFCIADILYRVLSIKDTLASAKHKIVKKLSLLICLLILKIVSTKDFLLLPSAPGAS